MRTYKMRRIVIVMTSFNRKELTDNSIGSILRYNYPNKHIIVVDDGSDTPYEFEHDDVTVFRIEKKDRKWVSPVVAYNKGIAMAINEKNAEIVILQNAEAYHYGDILKKVDEEITDNNYISFACFSTTDDMLPITDEKIEPYINYSCSATGNVELGWYNHSHYYPRYFDFCSAITVDNIKKLNGFDERFYKHVWYGDDNFVMRVREMGLDMRIIDMPFVAHQWHSRSHQPHGYTDESLMLFIKTIEERAYKAVHKFNDDL